MSLTKLSIINATFYAFHGVERSEKDLGGKYEVDIEMSYDATEAARTDAIVYAINYQNVLYIVSDIIQGDKFNLIETLSSKIIDELFEKFDLLQEITIRIRKCNAPIRNIIDYVQVENTLKRKKK